MHMAGWFYIRCERVKVRTRRSWSVQRVCMYIHTYTTIYIHTYKWLVSKNLSVQLRLEGKLVGVITGF